MEAESTTDQHDYDATDLDESSYRSLSGLAVVGLLLGLASPLIFIAPLLAAVPLVAIGVCAVALNRVGQNSEYLAGRGLALFGLVIAVGSFCAYHASGRLEKWLLSAQAQPHAKEWIELIRSSELEDAYQLTLDARARAAIKAADKRGEPSSIISSEEFARQPAVTTLAQLGTAGTVRHSYDGALQHYPNGKLQLSQMYEVTAADGKRVEVAVLMERNAGQSGAPALWRVMNIDLPANSR